MPQRYSVIRVSCAECGGGGGGLQREHQRGTAESLDGRAAAKGSSRTEPRCFYTPVAVNTSTLTRAILKVQKLYVRAIIRVLDERAYQRASERRSHARINHPSRAIHVCICTLHTRASRRFMLLIFAYIRKARTFTGVREIIYSSIDFLARFLWRASLTFGFNDSFATLAAIRSGPSSPSPPLRFTRNTFGRFTNAFAQNPSAHACENTTPTKLLEENPDGFISFSLIRRARRLPWPTMQNTIVRADLRARVRTSCGDYFFRQPLSRWIIVLRATSRILR